MERRLTFQVSVPTTERLDRFLADQLAISRTQAGRLIARHAVTVNSRHARPSHTLSLGDIVDVSFPSEERPRTIEPYSLDLTVIYEDEELMVIDKPAGLVVHPAPGHWDDTLVNALASRGTRLSAGGEGRPGIVHRLDKDTSGLMIIAKTDRAHTRLARAISGRAIEREYAALVWGHMPSESEIDAPVARHPRDRKRMAVLATGRAARTEVRQVARFGVGDLVRASLRTGRTHQIRVHLAHVGHPLIGDRVYAGGGARRISGANRPEAERVERNVERQALHAAMLRFRHPGDERMLELRSEWPRDLTPALGALSGDEFLLDRPNPLDYLGFFER